MEAALIGPPINYNGILTNQQGNWKIDGLRPLLRAARA